MKLRKFFRGLLLALAMFAVATTAWAKLSLQQAVEKVERETGGKVLAAETVSVGQQQIHRIKVLTRDGQVRVIQISSDSD
jgi:hypothetical protein